MLKKRELISCFQTVTTASFLVGMFLFSGQAQAQTPTINSADVDRYARSILALEPARQRAFNEIKKIVGSSDVPKILCNDANSFNALPRNARRVAVEYCNQSQKIVEGNGLTIDRFNLITIELQNNDSLKERIYNTLLRLQKNPNSR